MLYSNSKRVDAERLSSEIISLKDRVLGYQETIKRLQGSLKSMEQTKGRQEEDHWASLAEKDAVIKALKNQLAHISALAERNGTNTGIPTSATPINKKKTIPNTRRESGKPRGGQPGHERHTLPGFDEDEITDRNMSWTCLVRPVIRVREHSLIQGKQNTKMNLTLRSRL